MGGASSLVGGAARQRWPGTCAEQLARLCRALHDAGASDAPADVPAPAGFGLTGLAHACALGGFLADQRLVWSDILPGHPLLARICGMLASEHAGEREAAYRHALGHLRRARTTWVDAVAVPVHLLHRSVESAWWRDPPPTAPAPQAALWSMHEWVSALDWLVAAEAWRSPQERVLLHDLQRLLRSGGEMPAAEAALVRDILWFAETNGLGPQPGGAAAPGEGPGAG